MVWGNVPNVMRYLEQIPLDCHVAALVLSRSDEVSTSVPFHASLALTHLYEEVFEHSVVLIRTKYGEHIKCKLG
jgi:hypothetical protein